VNFAAHGALSFQNGSPLARRLPGPRFADVFQQEDHHG
jgi:hypothetical protein